MSYAGHRGSISGRPIATDKNRISLLDQYFVHQYFGILSQTRKRVEFSWSKCLFFIIIIIIVSIIFSYRRLLGYNRSNSCREIWGCAADFNNDIIGCIYLTEAPRAVVDQRGLYREKVREGCRGRGCAWSALNLCCP